MTSYDLRDTLLLSSKFVRNSILALIFGASFAVTGIILDKDPTPEVAVSVQTEATPEPDAPPDNQESAAASEAVVESAPAPGQESEQAPASPDGVERIPTPDPATAPDGDKTVITGEIQQGDTAEQILAPFVTSETFQEILKVTKGTHPLSRIRQGQPYTVVRSPEDGHMELFEYEIDRSKKLVIQRTDTGFMAAVSPIEYDIQTAVVRGRIDSSLFQAVASAGENPDLAIQLGAIFGSEINFIKDIREGDSFDIVVEKRYRDGIFRNYGPMRAARFVNQGKSYEGFRFTDENGAERYFNSKGESLAKTLLKAPLSFTRVTSGYTMSRKHPVYYDRRPHQGVDYGAPTGTPVKAVGDGTVTKSGWGRGFGNMVILRHSGGLESMYSHLSGFAKNARSGAKVRQGQVIGYVGSTGISTGPHLDFRLKQNGKYVNPTKYVAPRDNPVPRGRKSAFDQQVKEMQELLQ